MRSFKHRSVEPELMDGEEVGLADFAACLRDLAAVNTLTLARPPTLAFLRRATRGLHRGSRVSVLDVGFGHGDMLRRIHDWCRRRDLVPDLVGIDLNPLSAAVAAAATPAEIRIDYRTGDVFAFEPGRRFDFVISSLFTHHLGDRDLVAFLVWMERAAVRGWFVNDLHRHAIPYAGFKILARLARWHRFVQHDGPVSIARSFRREDWVRALREAGIAAEAAQIRWHMPFRLCVERLR